MANSSPKHDVNWSKYGLEGEQQQGSDVECSDTTNLMAGVHDNELFRENQESLGKHWWKSNFFVSQPILFGTWDGVYTSCLIHLFGVITFLRAGWVVGNAGLGVATLIVVISVLICTFAVLAAIGICQRCHHLGNGGNVHVLISNVLGSRMGCAVSIIYSFGQAVSCALHVIGFSESLTQLLNITDIWMERAIGVAIVLLLLLINIAGVKWVIRLQFILLFFLLLAYIDFITGVITRTDPENGVIGYSIENIKNNWEPNSGQTALSLFYVFGVFFPAVTGVMAGINMSGDLHNPSESIPNGTLSAIGTSLLLYLSFVFGLGAICIRSSLLTDYMIAQKASTFGIFLLMGLFISSLSYSLGSLYATPRIIQNIANENIIPVIKFLAKGKGANKVPVNALVLFSIVTLIFILIGKINDLAPIVTIPYLLTYATVEYAYFSLAMTFDIQIKRESKFMASAEVTSPTFDTFSKSKDSKHINYGSTKNNDLDRLFPERVQTKHIQIKRQVSSQSSSRSSSVDRSPDPTMDRHHESSSADDSFGSTDSSLAHDSKLDPNEIKCKQNVWYSPLMNRWIIILAALVKITIMFLVQWAYALSAFITFLFLWYYIGQVNPGVFPGISEFKMYPWITRIVLKCLGKNVDDSDQIIVSNSTIDMNFQSDQLTKENTDFSGREPYHQSSTSQYEATPVLIDN